MTEAERLALMARLSELQAHYEREEERKEREWWARMRESEEPIHIVTQEYGRAD